MNVRRGFHRLGTVGVYTALAIAAWFLSVAAWQGLRGIEGDGMTIALGIAFTAPIVGAAFYALCRATGWIISGFTAEGRQ